MYEATWENMGDMNMRFLEFYLEDKVRFWEGSNDTTDVGHFGQVCRRRDKH